MSDANKAIVRRWFKEVWNEGSEDTIEELFAAGGVAHGLGDTEADVHGPAEFKPFARNLRSSIANLHIAVEDVVAEGDRVALRIHLTGVHNGDALGVPATGRALNVRGLVIVRIAEGKIVEAWNSWDQLGLLRQIDALPRAGGSDQFLTERA
jgi:steroid delta-isomerase-like uncharacterized protein